MAKAASLAAQTGALGAEFQLPSVFSKAPPAITERYIAPYVSFAHGNRKDEWKKLTDKFGSNIQEGQMFLFEQGSITALNPMKCSWLAHQQMWVEGDANGNPVRVSFTEAPRPFLEVIEAVVLVYLEDRIVPANVTFRTTKCPAAHDMAEALAECQTAAWEAKGQAYKETLAVQQPFFRFYGVVSLAPSRTSRSTGRPYTPTACSVNPTGVAEWRLLKAFTESGTSQKLLEDAGAKFQSRIEDMRKKEVK